MPSITVNLTEAQLAHLDELARRLNLPPEQLVQAGVVELLARPETDFQQAVEQVLKKNAELYRRLA